MTNVFLLGAKYAQEGHEIEKTTLQEMWDIRSGDFSRCGILPNNFVYKICEDAYKASQEGRALVNDEASHHALRSMADIGLFLNRQKYQGKEVEFNNPSQLMELLEASRTLKGIHPDLFEKYGFKENLEVLAKLQLQRNGDLEPKIQGAMNAIFHPVTAERNISSRDESIK